ncbi:MAG: tetratricopeptide repeat protein [Saprospiraceae bacterium]
MGFLVSCTDLKNSTQPDNYLDAQSGLKRNIGAGESHLYTIDLKEGDLLHMEIEQFNIDVVIQIADADSQYVQEFDTPTGDWDAEHVYLKSDHAGVYTIRINTEQKFPDPGMYAFESVEIRKSTEQDKAWMAALATTKKADTLRARADTRLQSTPQYESALDQWKAIGDTKQYANTLRAMGFTYVKMKIDAKAMEVFSQVLPLWKELKDTRSEGFTYLILAGLHKKQKNFSKSLDLNLSALEAFERAGDAGQSAFTLLNIGHHYLEQGDSLQAVQFYDKALIKSRDAGQPSIVATILREYAKSLSKLGEQKKAAQLYVESMEGWKLTANRPAEARTAATIASFYSDIGSKR